MRVFVLLTCLSLYAVSCSQLPDSPLNLRLEPIAGQLIDVAGKVLVESDAVLSDPDYFVWGGSVVQGEDDRYHMFYSIFDAGADKPPFGDAWLLSSKIAYAVSDHPDSSHQHLPRNFQQSNRPPDDDQ